MEKRTAIGHGKYWLSAKPPSRKKKFRERRQNQVVERDENKLCPTDVGNMESPENSFEKTAAENNGTTISHQIAADFMDDPQIEVSEDETQEVDVAKPSDRSIVSAEFSGACCSDLSLPDLIIEPVSKNERENESEPPGTRHIVDIGYMFSELQREFSNHDQVMGCTLDYVDLISTKRIGLQTHCLFHCRLCLKKKFITSEVKESNILSVNESAVAAAVSVGIGYSQSKEMFNAMNIPYMCQGTYQQYHDKINSGFEKAANKEMRLAGEEEK